MKNKQDQILATYEDSNKLASFRMLELLGTGEKLIMTSTLEGPYVKYESYYFSNEEVVELVSRADLSWVTDTQFLSTN